MLYFLVLDMAFESDDSVSPLESAVEVLRNLSDKCSISQEVIEKVCTSIKEMVSMCACFCFCFRYTNEDKHPFISDYFLNDSVIILMVSWFAYMACIYSQLVVICLKNGEFEKAKEILRKHFPCGMMGKVLYILYIFR